MIGTIPSLKGARTWNAPTDKSMELLLVQDGQASLSYYEPESVVISNMTYAITTTTELPLLLFVICTFCPHRGDCEPVSP